MIDFLLGLIEEHAFLGLFITSFLASTILPLGSEVFVVLLISKGFDTFTIIMVASIGNYLGACTTYYIGLIGRRDIIERFFSISREQLEKTDKLFAKYGVFLLLLTWMPIIGDAIAAMGGILKLDFKVFSFYVFIGKMARYTVLSYITVGALAGIQ
ncbi:YqaA family protein [Methanolobus mangrovi]|uniref:YqaA family protein n=1 Tax=Methanolobus mangrovi TaxID=3072977 RepID=A0AA51UEG9_9EURY|nr:YqaA family protein [Methanolobus mangrovi]WMW21474.1 YqaA family protein [Methanolobus mangrovi]